MERFLFSCLIFVCFLCHLVARGQAEETRSPRKVRDTKKKKRYGKRNPCYFSYMLFYSFLVFTYVLWLHLLSEPLVLHAPDMGYHIPSSLWRRPGSLEVFSKHFWENLGKCFYQIYIFRHHFGECQHT